MKIYEVIDYDVWGNSRDGYDVNNIILTDIFVSLTENPSIEQVIRALKSEGYIRQNCRFKTFRMDNIDSSVIYLERAKDGLPICELRLAE